MNKKNKIVIFSLFILICISLSIIISISKDNKNITGKSLSGLAVYVYDEDEEDYIADDEIPTGSYTLNTTSSYCKGNGEIGEYDSTNGTISYTFTSSDQCYLYFDINSTVYLYAWLDKTKPAGYNTTAVYGLKRFTGANQLSDTAYAGNVDNFICLGTSDKTTCLNDTDTYLYRIVGTTKTNSGDANYTVDGLTKVVKNTSIGNYNWDGGTSDSEGTLNNQNAFISTGWTGRTKSISECYGYDLYSSFSDVGCLPSWNESLLRTTILNGTFYNNLSLSLKDKTISMSWHHYIYTFSDNYIDIDTGVSNELSSINYSYTDKISLVYAADVLCAYDVNCGTGVSNPYSWMKNFEMTMSYVEAIGFDGMLNIGNYIDSRYINLPGDYIDIYHATQTSVVEANMSIIDATVYYEEYCINCTGSSCGEYCYSYLTKDQHAAHPSFYLANDVVYLSGSGTSIDPILVDLSA